MVACMHKVARKLAHSCLALVISIVSGQATQPTLGSSRALLRHSARDVNEGAALTNLIRNGDFDNGLAGWDLGISGGANAAMKPVNSDLSVWSPPAVRVVITTTAVPNNSWTIQFRQQISPTAGLTYSVHFVLKADAERIFRVVVQTSNGSRVYCASETLIGTATAKDYSFMCAITETVESYTVLSFDFGAHAASTTLDKVTFMPLLNQPNLLVNGGFETGNMQAWKVQNDSQWLLSNSAPPGGNWYARLLNHGWAEQDVATVPGQTYSVSADVRLDRVVITPTYGYMVLDVYDDEANRLNSYRMRLDEITRTQWLHPSYTFTAQSLTTTIWLGTYQDNAGVVEASFDNAVMGTGPIALPRQPTVNLYDPLNDLNLTHEVSDLTHLFITHDSAASFENDDSRLVRTGNSIAAEWVAWKVEGMRTFTATAYYVPGVETSRIWLKLFRFYYSADNVSYTRVAPTFYFANTDWNRVSYIVSLPAGARYVKAAFPANTNQFWSPQLGSVGILTTAISSVRTNPNNVAPDGSPYVWYQLLEPIVLSDVNRIEAPGLTDGDLLGDNPISGEPDLPGVYQAAGVVWAQSKKIDRVAFTNGSNIGQGVFIRDLHLQITQDGATWQRLSVPVSPTYAYDSVAAGGKTFTFTTNFTESVRGVRIAGRVADSSSSHQAFIAEVEAYAPTISSRVSLPFVTRAKCGQGPPEQEPNNTTGQANELVSCVTRTGTTIRATDAITDHDYFSINLPVTGSITVTLSGHADVSQTISSSYFQLLLRSPDSSNYAIIGKPRFTAPWVITATNLIPGIYYVQLFRDFKPPAPIPNPNAQYQLTATFP